MKRLIRHILNIGAVSVLLSGVGSADVITHLYGPEASSESSFLQERMPWVHARLAEWQKYLSQKPVMDHVPVPAAEELSFQFSHAWATKGFDSAGRPSDPSVVAFGRSSFAVQDAFVASRLLVNEEARVMRSVTDAAPLANNSRHFLYLLADQEIAFESSHSRQEVMLTYKRAFLNKKLSFQIDCPFVRQENNIDLAPVAEISRANRDALVEATSLNSAVTRNALGALREGAEAPGFYQAYSNMNNFLQHVLKDTGITFEKRQEEIGLGDMRVSVSYDQPIRYVDASQFGVQLKLNTGKTARQVALAEPALGDGAIALSTHARLSWHRSVYVNPFIVAQAGYSLPTRQAARLPYSLSYNGASHIGDRMIEVFPRTIPFSDVVALGGAAFSEYPESVVRGFASTAQTVTMHKGIACSFEVGNTFEKCFGQPMFATVSYRFNRQQETHLSGIENPRAYALDVVTHNTGTRSHDLYVIAGYRLSPLCSVHGGWNYRFAGRNVHKEARVFGGLSLQF